MEGITSEEFAVRRMENLQQYLRELPIEELEEHTLTYGSGLYAKRWHDIWRVV